MDERTTVMVAAIGAMGTAVGVIAKHGFDAWWRRRKVDLEADRFELDRERAQDAAAAALREEMLAELKRQGALIENLRGDVDQWRRSYWQAVEERETLRSVNQSLTVVNEQLTGQITSLTERVSALTGEVEMLRQTNRQLTEEVAALSAALHERE